MKEKKREVMVQYRGGIAAGIIKFEKMKPNVEKMIQGTLEFEQSTDDHQKVGIIKLKVSRNCGTLGLMEILRQFGFRQV